MYFLPNPFFKHSAAWVPGRAGKRREESGKLLGSQGQEGDLGIFTTLSLLNSCVLGEKSYMLEGFSPVTSNSHLGGPELWLYTILIKAF